MRTTKDLIEELKQVAANEPTLVAAGLVVGFEHHCSYVFVNDTNKLDRLNAFVLQGGEPIGIVVVTREGKGEGTVKTRPLEEYRDDDHINKVLIALAEIDAAMISGCGSAATVN